MTTITRSVVLNLGCGSAPGLPDLFPDDQWEEIRVDADPAANPDVIADMRALPFDDGYANAIICMGVLEHIEESSLASVLDEMRRVLRDGGELKLLVPDLQAIAVEIANGRLTDTLFETDAGPIRALDMIYGFSPLMADHPLWGHRMGFTGDTLAQWLGAAGFQGTIAKPEAAPYMLTADVAAVGATPDRVG